MTQLVINLSRVTQQVGIVDSKGRRTSFRLMARGRVETDYEIEPSWLAHNPGVIKVVQITPPVDTTAADTPTSTASATSTKSAKKTVAATETVVATSISTDSTPAEGAA